MTTSRSSAHRGDSAANTSYMNFKLDRFLTAVAAREPAPGGGAVAAVTAAAAAALTAMAARFSDDSLADSGELAGEADRLRERVAPLAEADARAYGEVLKAYALPRSPNPDARRERVRAAMLRATEVPAQIAGVGADIAALALRLLKSGNAHLAGDAYTAVVLCEAAVRAAATLVRINANAGKLGDELINDADARVQDVERASEHALTLINNRYAPNGSARSGI